jgi:RNA polymerase sigma factor (sigma-70 family)
MRPLPPDDDDVIIEISRIARKIAGKRFRSDVADDVAQDVVLECLTKLRAGELRVDPSSLTALVRQMVDRQAIDRLRQQDRSTEREAEFERERVSLQRDWMNPEATREDRELEEFRERAMAMLPPMARRVYQLVRDRGMTHEAAAQELGITRPTVEWHMWVAHRRIRALCDSTTPGSG